MSKVAAFCMLLLWCTGVFAQETIRSEPFGYYLEIISELSQRNDEEQDFNDLAWELFELWESPVDINNAEPYDLARLFWLSEFQLNKLTEYVRKNSPVVSVYELAYVDGFDSTMVMSLSPFIILTEKASYRKMRPEHWIMVRTGKTLQQQKGYREGKFEGDAWKQNLRYKFALGEKVQAGFNMEKDAGESLFRGSNRAGPDFYAGYLKINNIGKLKTLCLGNFQAGFGQGLVAGPGFALGKSSQAMNVIMKEYGIKAYTSNDENRFLQGAAATFSFRPVELSVFASVKKVDANISESDSAGRIQEVSTLQTTGYHSTTSEIANEDALKEFTAGGRLLYRKSRFHAGVTFLMSSYDARINPKPTPYNQFYFRGNRQRNIGIDYKYNFYNTTLFGEQAMDANGNAAFLNGISTNAGSRIQFSVLHRYYSRAYHSFYSNAFGENTAIRNEEGIYSGIRMALIKKVTLAFYADFFRFPWLKYRVYAPSFGREYMVQAEINPAGSFSAILQFRYKQKMTNSPDTTDFMQRTAQAGHRRIRIHIIYRATETFTLSSRLETVLYSEGKSSKSYGYLAYQDIRYSFRNIPVQLNARYAIFRTDDYDSRIYAYESDVLYAFSVNSFYKQGQRFYGMIKFSPFSKTDVWIRYSQSVFPGEKSTGSGLYEIEGNKRSDIRIQAILKF